MGVCDILSRIRAVTVIFYCCPPPVVTAFQLKSIYCTISDSCDCDFKPDVQGLEWDLYKNLYGQHLAQEVVSEAVADFLKKESPDIPLVMSFHGASGTGKTLVSSMLGRHLYGAAMGSPYIHQFIPTLHFPLPDRVKRYRSELKTWVEGNLTTCKHSIFIFDEMETMPPGVIDVLAPFLGPSHVVFQTNYRKAIYIFISTTGEDIINKLTLETRHAGKEREDIQLLDLEAALSQAVFNNKNSGFFRSKIISDKSITYFVPFLPLNRRHVERCARRELCQRGECQRRDVIEAVGSAMTYTPQLFSSTGCKSVPAKVNLFL
ncbi:prosalusin [Megalops cyprinoides]|uniref:prosalusin n=1 Tax=Megalops cyprinoides TaxID=118141 RepID=UPI0018647411|nr:prosalusin [Megalops cyprinoides]